MGIKFDGGISLQTDGGVAETKTDSARQCNASASQVTPQNVCTPYAPDTGVPYTPAAPAQSNETGETIKASEL